MLLQRQPQPRKDFPFSSGFQTHAQGGLIWLRDWESADELRAAIATWLRHYLHHRPHQALNRQTPPEPRAERLATPIALAA